MNTPRTPPVLLASGSPYRRALLARILDDFEVAVPGIDETAHDGESPPQGAARLALCKAMAVRDRHPGALVIGSDQVAALGDERLGKPGSAARAVEQLLRCSGQTMTFTTAVCLLPPDGPALQHIDIALARFRRLTPDEARDYVAADAPLDCAGSFKVEQRGVTLLEELRSSDPTGIIGLPLIWLSARLRGMGIRLC